MSVCQAFYISYIHSYIWLELIRKLSLVRHWSLERQPVASVAVRSSRTCDRASMPSSLPSESRRFRRGGPAALRRARPRARARESLAGECSPPLDVFETDDAVEIVGRPAGRRPRGASASLIKGDVVLIAGEKAPRRGRGRVELSPGRARIRPLRARRARSRRRSTRAGRGATLRDGELRVALPKIAERRGRGIDRADRPPAAGRVHEAALHRRHRRAARAASSCGAALRGARRPPRHRPRDRQRRERRRPASASRARSATSCSTAGVDVMTSGNHIWDKNEALDYIGAEPRLLRPANYPAGAPGHGSYLARTARRRDGRRRST